MISDNIALEIDLAALHGAKVMDIAGKKDVRRCICIPIDNMVGTVTASPDALRSEDPDDVKRVLLRLTGFLMAERDNGRSHRLKPTISREQLEVMTNSDKRRIPWVGSVYPWHPKPYDTPDKDW